MAHTTLFPAALGMIRLMHTVIKKTHIVLPRGPSQQKLVAKLKVSYGLNILQHVA